MYFQKEQESFDLSAIKLRNQLYIFLKLGSSFKSCQNVSQMFIMKYFDKVIIPNSEFIMKNILN